MRPRIARAGAAAMAVFLQRFAPSRAPLIALGLAAGTAALTVSGLRPHSAAPVIARSAPTFQDLLTVPYDGTNVIDAADPELHRYPIAYVSEPGEWSPTQQEIDNLSDYLFKGGFLILDDFRSDYEWRIVEEIFQLIAPGHRFRVLGIDEPVFDSFFDIATLDIPPPTFPQFRPVFLGLHENNDPTGRLMAIANFNNDIGDYWEYSDRGYVPIELSNEAYKFGVNYVIYAMNR